MREGSTAHSSPKAPEDCNHDHHLAACCEDTDPLGLQNVQSVRAALRALTHAAASGSAGSTGSWNVLSGPHQTVASAGPSDSKVESNFSQSHCPANATSRSPSTQRKHTNEAETMGGGG